MSASSSRPFTIDLSGKKRETFDSVFYRWAINVGKTIIVLVELIALSALFYRFYIDRQLVDQREEIERQALLVRAQRDKEIEFESIQARITAVAETQATTEAIFGIVAEIREALDTGLFESGEVVINQDVITFQGRAFSIFDIESFADKLAEDVAVKTIEINEITSSEQGIRFTMTITLVESKRIL